MTYKQPVSVLVVIYAKDTGRVLMLQRRDDPDFWLFAHRLQTPKGYQSLLMGWGWRQFTTLTYSTSIHD